MQALAPRVVGHQSQPAWLETQAPFPARASSQSLGWMSGLTMPLEASAEHRVQVQGTGSRVDEEPCCFSGLLGRSSSFAGTIAWYRGPLLLSRGPTPQSRASKLSTESQKVTISTLCLTLPP